ncbi:MAG: hypothetical protein R2827_02900 [Bdellovibrionales bacterium]
MLSVGLKQFKNFTRGIDKKGRQPEELRSFLQRNFLEGNTISDSLLQEAMIIKQVMVGGDLDLITDQDLDRGIELLQIVQKHAVLLRPYINILTLSVDSSDLKDDEIENAIEQMKKSAQHIGVVLGFNQKDYPFDRFRKFVTEFRRFLNWGNEGSSGAFRQQGQ